MKHSHKLLTLAALTLVTAAALVGVARSSGELAQAASQAVPSNTSPPTITGIPERGQSLVADPGTWSDSPTSFGYQWQRCDTQVEGTCADIPGETTNARTLVQDDVGHYIRVKVRATNGDGTSIFVSSAMTEQIRQAQTPASARLPAISGTAREGETLTADRGEWSNNPTSFAYQWQRCNADGASCSSIAGETSNARVLTGSDVGHRLRVVVTASNVAGSSSFQCSVETPRASSSAR
jgi:hypothetical protein